MRTCVLKWKITSERLNNFRDQFDSDEEDKLRSVLGDALLRYNINVFTIY